VVAKIENRLANFEINGKTTRMSKLKSIEDNINDEIKKGAGNIIVAGDDSSVRKVVNIIANYENIVLGIIPLGYNIEISKLLGIPYGEEACEVLSSRKIEKIDLGKINNKFFISEIFFKKGNVEINCDGMYTIKSIEKNIVKICNMCAHKKKINYFNPKDGFLEILIEQQQTVFDRLMKKEKKEESIFQIKKALVNGKNSFALSTDGEMSVKTPFTIGIAPRKLKIIVGKDRVF